MPNDTSYALPMPCLGSYGGPVDPNVALGGFNGKPLLSSSLCDLSLPPCVACLSEPVIFPLLLLDFHSFSFHLSFILCDFIERNGSFNYQNATALIVTFTVNNHVDDADNTLAKIWEQGFLDYISTYTSDNLEVSYMAEVSSCGMH